MSLFDLMRYDGKRALVVGAATGMGAGITEVLADAGADLTVMDYAPMDVPGATAISVNLADKASIDEAVGQCKGSFDAVFAAAGVADGTPGIERINFAGHRHLIDSLISKDMLKAGSAVGFISSAAGLSWEKNLDSLTELLATPDFDSAAKWLVDNNKADYFNTKQAVCAYVARQAMDFLKMGIRINAICPGPTDTPLAEANAATWLGFGADYRAELGISPATAREQAYPLVFLCSAAASAITGITLVSDAGYFASGISGSYPPATGIAKFLMGRS